MYIEASFRRKLGDKARLVSPLHLNQGNSDRQSCMLDFWYQMYGVTIATLNVYSRSAGVDNTETLMWSLSGNQLDAWHPSSISFVWSQPFPFEVHSLNSTTYKLEMSFG